MDLGDRPLGKTPEAPCPLGPRRWEPRGGGWVWIKAIGIIVKLKVKSDEF